MMAIRRVVPRDTYRYFFKVGNEIVHRGITNGLDRRETEHQQRWPNGHIEQIGPAVTRDGGLEWERRGGPRI